MLSHETRNLLAALRQTTPQPDVTAYLEQTPAEQLVGDIRTAYPWTFQERRLNRKWEIGLARRYQVDMRARPVANSDLLFFELGPTYHRCLMLSIEGNRITGLSRFSLLTVRVIRKPTPGLALRMSRGSKLDLLPDGWEMKPFASRTVRLNEAFLRQRGWKFEHLRQVVPTP